MLVARWVVRTAVAGVAVAAACASASLKTAKYPAAGRRLQRNARALLQTSGEHSLQLLAVQLYQVLLPVCAVHLCEFTSTPVSILLLEMSLVPQQTS